MNASELRLGNYIQIKLSKTEIAKVEELLLEFNDDSSYYFLRTILLSDNKTWFDPISFFEPIPITEEWLFKFGFEKNGWYYEIFGLEILDKSTNEFVIEYNFNSLKARHRINVRSIKYVHQLQNLYYFLNKKELTIKQ